MLRCSKCKKDKIPEEFALNNSRPSGRQSQCRLCKKLTDAKHHRENKEKQKIRNKTNRSKSYAFTKQLKESTPCTDCGKFYPSYVMDFDHISDKVKDISIMCNSATSIKNLMIEIAKCEIVCSNCHRIRTFGRLYGSVV